jgi:beta-galactosidase GanA
VLPEELKLWCHEAYAAGAKGLIYWMWRPFTKGLQTLGRGIVNYRTVPTERYGLVKEMSEELFGKYGVITPVRSKVGVLYHELSDDLSRKYACYNTVDSDIYLRSVFGAYKAFMDSGVRADIITLDELSGYECVVITNACAMSRADCDRIAEFVKGGGRVILDGKVAIVDEESMQYEYIPGGGLHELVGEIYFETDNRYSSFELDGAKYNFFYGRDRVELTGAQVLASFPDGLPAFVKKACGKGEAYTFNLHLFYSYAKGEGNSAALIAKRLADELSLRQLECDAPLSVRLAKSGDKTLVFAFNYTKDGINDATVTVDGTTIKVSVPENGVAVKEI